MNKSKIINSKSNSLLLLPTIPEDDQFSGTSSSRIKVVVRVRPLTPKEIISGQNIIVREVGDENCNLAVWDPAGFELKRSSNNLSLDPSCWAKPFHFDRVLWSIDPSHSNYASQSVVFDELGKPVIDWVMNGYNACVLAYGQTGGGKTYTMTNINNQSDPTEYGLTPRICFGLFEALQDHKRDKNKDSTITFSYIEIYNEIVRDLLSVPSQQTGLKVREHPQQGIFIPNLTIVKVGSFEDVMSLISIGDKNRTIASTNSNVSSSRSHAIVNLTITQRQRNIELNGLPTSSLQQKSSKVYLVDLAGSERVAFSGATGNRLKEANHINVSLSVLGDVIKSLGDASRKGYRTSFIPYRNSTLTMVLRESLGGNAHTIMLSAISPSGHDYEETLSTLKYADRAKRVKLQVKANITSGLLATDASAVHLVPLLQAEVRKLREMLKQQQQQQLTSQNLSTINSQFYHSVEETNPSKHLYNQHHLNLNNRDVVDNEKNSRENITVLEMKARVEELESQLAEREKLILSLENTSHHNNPSISSPSRSSNNSDSNDTSSLCINEYTINAKEATKVSNVKLEIASSLNDGDDSISLNDILSNSPQSHTTKPVMKLRRSIGGTTVNFPLIIDDSMIDNNLKPQQNSTPNSPTRLSRAASITSIHSHPLVLLAEEAQTMDISLPRVVNLNQDPLFSEVLVYYISTSTIVAGSKAADADILLSGPDILDQHCIMRQIGNTVWLRPLPGALVFVNGDVLPSPTPSIKSSLMNSNKSVQSDHLSRSSTLLLSVGFGGEIDSEFTDEDMMMNGRALEHVDRIAFGRFHLFRFESKQVCISNSFQQTEKPSLDDNSQLFPLQLPGWDYAQEEMLQKNHLLMSLPVKTSSNQRRRDVHSNQENDSYNQYTSQSTLSILNHNSEVNGYEHTQTEKEDNNHSSNNTNSHPNQQPFNSNGHYREVQVHTTAVDLFPVEDTRHDIYHEERLRQLRMSESIPPTHIHSNHTTSSTVAGHIVESIEILPASHEVFEKEARALQEELAQMQRTLQDRMQKYNRLTTIPLLPKSI